MPNKFGIPEDELLKIRARDLNCVYCRKVMIYPCVGNKQSDWATTEHLSSGPPFYWKDGMKLSNIVICCGSCNSSRGVKNLPDWFKTRYCVERKINESNVSEPVTAYLKSIKENIKPAII